MENYGEQNQKNGNHLARWTAALVLLFIAAFGVFVLIKLGQPVSTNGEDMVFEVSAGASGKEISRQLAEAKLVNSPFFFDLYVYLRGYSGKIQAGSYLLSPAMPIFKIADKLVSGEAITDDVKITIIEGWGISDIAEKVEELGIAGQTEFISIVGQPRVGGADDLADEFDFLAAVPKGNSLEGFLFPDTYFIDKQATAGDAVRKFLQNFERKVIDNPELKIESSKLTLYETITLASIVEREVGRNAEKGAALGEADRERVSEERRVVAGIFQNRLKIGMALQSDATVGYITGSKSARATLAETRLNSPYNTYKNTGLPPGPISNPSLDAIAAAVNPVESDYLYFLTAPDGTAHFAEDLDGHQRNREQYLD